jgi:hypothetical protein
MISELTSVSGAINALTGLNGLPATIVEVVVTLLVRAYSKSGMECVNSSSHSILPLEASGPV